MKNCQIAKICLKHNTNFWKILTFFQKMVTYYINLLWFVCYSLHFLQKQTLNNNKIFFHDRHRYFFNLQKHVVQSSMKMTTKLVNSSQRSKYYNIFLFVCLRKDIDSFKRIISIIIGLVANERFSDWISSWLSKCLVNEFRL